MGRLGGSDGWASAFGSGRDSSVPGLWVRGLSWGQMLSDWATQLPLKINFSKKDLPIYFRERESTGAGGGAEGGAEGERILKQTPPWTWIPEPWDHDLSQNQDLATQLTELPECLKNKLLKK